MPEQEHEMPTILHERVGKLEQETHTLKHQVGKLEHWPHRVTDLERTVENLNVNMINLQKSQQELRDETRHGFHDLSSQVDAGFKEFGEAISTSKGDKIGFGRAIKWATGMITLAAAAITAIIWLNENSGGLISSATVVGMAAQCKDGTYSTSGSRGACSGHGGVERWLND